MNQKRTFSENLKGAWGLLSMKDKILLCVQSVLSITIIVLVNLSMNNVLPMRTLITVDLPLLSLLFVVSGVRNFPKRKLSVVFCIMAAAAMLVLMWVSL